MQARSGGARVKRIKTKVQWTFVPLNGLATDGKHRTCKREHGERSAASPVVNNRRQVTLVFRETWVVNRER